MGIACMVLARDSQAVIEDCLRSLAWADELIVLLDDRSTDRTAEVAQSLGARVEVHRFESFCAQREYGLSLTEQEWLFYVDSDERATEALEREIRQVTRQSDVVGWWVPRRNFVCGHEIRHGGWHPDYQLRLLKLGYAHYDMTREVHEVVDLDGAEGHLQEPLVHFNYVSWAEFREKQAQYVAFEADILLKQGVRPHPWTYLLQPLREFWRRYVRLEGYRDGWPGLRLCVAVAYHYGFLVTRQLARRWRTEESDQS